MAKETEPQVEKLSNKILGGFLILISVAGFISTAILSVNDLEKIQNGTIPAISFLVLIVGITFYFPSMLEESPGEISTMRVVVLITILVFAIIYIKLGWTAGSFEEFNIDPSWVYILGLAFGSKAFQKFAEDEAENPKVPEAKAPEDASAALKMKTETTQSS